MEQIDISHSNDKIDTKNSTVTSLLSLSNMMSLLMIPTFKKKFTVKAVAEVGTGTHVFIILAEINIG